MHTSSIKIVLECMACHRDLRVLISFHTYIYKIWTMKCTFPVEIIIGSQVDHDCPKVTKQIS